MGHKYKFHTHIKTYTSNFTICPFVFCQLHFWDFFFCLSCLVDDRIIPWKTCEYLKCWFKCYQIAFSSWSHIFIRSQSFWSAFLFAEDGEIPGLFFPEGQMNFKDFKATKSSKRIEFLKSGNEQDILLGIWRLKLLILVFNPQYSAVFEVKYPFVKCLQTGFSFLYI